MTEGPFELDCIVKQRKCRLHLTLNPRIIQIELEDKVSREKWESAFVPSYVENLSKRIGNFKTFSTFSLMLKALFLKNSKSMSMELVFQQDLETMSPRSQARLQGTTYPVPKGSCGKYPNVKSRESGDQKEDNYSHQRIYMIVIYSGEFDKSHYPLPLDYQGLPNARVLFASIERLQKENLSLKNQLKHAKCMLQSKLAATKFIHDAMKRACVVTIQNQKMLKTLQDIHNTVMEIIRSLITELKKQSSKREKDFLFSNNKIHLLETENQLLNNLVERYRSSGNKSQNGIIRPEYMHQEVKIVRWKDGNSQKTKSSLMFFNSSWNVNQIIYETSNHNPPLQSFISHDNNWLEHQTNQKSRTRRNAVQFRPRLGREEDIIFTETSRSPPFAPRLGRMLPFSPHFGRLADYNN